MKPTSSITILISNVRLYEEAIFSLRREMQNILRENDMAKRLKTVLQIVLKSHNILIVKYIGYKVRGFELLQGCVRWKEDNQT